MRNAKRTIGSRKALLFDPSKGNGRRRNHRVFIYSQMGNVTKLTFPQKPTIAIAIENPSVRANLSRILRRSNCQVIMFEDGLATLEYFGGIMLLGPQEIVPDLVIAEIFFLLDRTKGRSKGPPIPSLGA